MERKYNVAIDFDGVIYDKVTGASVEGALVAIRKLLEDHEVIIFTARDDLENVRIILEDWGFPKMKVTNRKPVAMWYVDDHAVRFDGDWNTTLMFIERGGYGWQDKENNQTNLSQSVR